MYITYVIQSKPFHIRYIGQTSDLNKRLFAHNNGLSRYTKNRGPWKLIYCKEFNSRGDAIKYEKYLKTGKGREFLDNLGQ